MTCLDLKSLHWVSSFKSAFYTAHHDQNETQVQPQHVSTKYLLKPQDQVQAAVVFALSTSLDMYLTHHLFYFAEISNCFKQWALDMERVTGQ